MRNIFSKSKATFAIILVSLFVLTSLQSCDKAKQFEGTTWKSNTFETVKILQNIDIDDDGDPIIVRDTVNFKLIVTISFSKENADVVANLSYTHPFLGYVNGNEKGTASYSYKKKDMSVNVRWNRPTAMDILDQGMWKGTADKTTMTLKNVFDETVTFTKQ